MKTKLLTLFLSLCLIFTFVLTACGDDRTDATEGGTTPGDVTVPGDGANTGDEKEDDTDHPNTPAKFQFIPTEDELGYILTAVDLDSIQKVQIPATYSGKPVLAIAAGASVINGGSITELTIPDSVMSIGENAFCRMSSLTKIIFGSGIRAIGAYAFSGCFALKTIEMSGTSTIFSAQGNCLIETATKTVILGTFNCSIPNDGSVTAIASGAFSYYDIGTVTLPQSITVIEENAFYNCSITNFHYEGTKADWEAIEKDEKWCAETDPFDVICSDGNVRSHSDASNDAEDSDGV